MEILLKRYKSNNTTTLGKLYIEEEFGCFVLEDAYREEKIKGRTRIPGGVYEIVLREYGRFHKIYKKRYSAFHVGMLELRGVPNFINILIHPGNTHKDTSGCLLLGEKVDEEKMVIVAGTSTPAYISVYKKLSSILLKKEKIFIRITDLDKKDIEITKEDLVIRNVEEIKRG